MNTLRPTEGNVKKPKCGKYLVSAAASPWGVTIVLDDSLRYALKKARAHDDWVAFKAVGDKIYRVNKSGRAI
jgi:hypothetical protein